METISPQRFLDLRELRHLTQYEMGNLLGVSAKYIGMIERGEKQVDSQSSLGLLFQVQENLPAGKKKMPVVNLLAESSPSNQREIPVIGWAHAGAAESYEELPKSWQDKIPTECRDEKAFAVSLEGDSMAPRFGEGDLLVVQPSEVAYSGCFVVAKFVNDGVVFRRIEMSGPRISLVPLNERYDVTTHAPEEFSWIYPVWGRWTQIWKR